MKRGIVAAHGRAAHGLAECCLREFARRGNHRPGARRFGTMRLGPMRCAQRPVDIFRRGVEQHAKRTEFAKQRRCIIPSRYRIERG